MSQVQEVEASADVLQNMFDVVILPSAAVREEAIRLSRDAARRVPTRFQLSNGPFLPHISLYHIAVAPERFEDFSEALGGIARIDWGEEPLLMEERLVVYGSTGSIWWNVLSAYWLYDLATEVLGQLREFYDRTVDAERLWGSLLTTPERRASFGRYRTPFAEDFFEPHITITTAERPEDAPEIPTVLSPLPLWFLPHELSVCRVGPSMSCHDVVRQVSLVTSAAAADR